MNQYPLLVLPKAKPTKREPGSQKFVALTVPSPKRQQERLGSKFERLEKVIAEKIDRGTISADTEGIYPESTIVFELAAPRNTFKAALDKIGLTWVGEDEFELLTDTDFRSKDKSKLEGRMYLTSPDQRSLNALLGLWKLYLKGDLKVGQKVWNDLFSHLKDIRRWGPIDRIPRETLAYLQDSREKDDVSVRLEIEAVFFGNKKKDDSVNERLVTALAKAGAAILDSVTIEEIRYHALLVAISKEEIEKLLDFSSSILKIEEIGYVRPQSLSASPQESKDSYSENYEDGSHSSSDLKNPVAALFDGVPIQNHDLLAGRLILDDPEDLQSISPVSTRRHGTAMASLILHGDLALQEQALDRKLIVHCLLSASSESDVETTDKDRLILGLIYDAVKAIHASEDPEYKNICIINLSLGDANRPFSGQITPWARLLDYLSWRYSLLFIVSAGNISHPVQLKSATTPAALKSLTIVQRRESFIKAWESTLSQRTILSPAESINALTVGASHSDGSTPVANGFLIDPFESNRYPSLISALGLGYRKSVKPDILHCGGRTLYSHTGTSGMHFTPSGAVKYFGQQVAGTKSANFTTRLVGTSNAAALATRAAIQLYDVIQSLKVSSPQLSVEAKYIPSLLKGLLVHSASWGEAGTFLEKIIEPTNAVNWQARRTNISRFLGFGPIDPSRVLTCTDHRVTLVGTGSLAPEKAEIFEFPLPPALSGSKVLRRLIVTLAWVTPIKPGQYVYRASALEFRAEDKSGFSIGTKRAASSQPPGDAIRRGTVVHEIFEGQDAVPIIDGNKLRLRVESKDQGAGKELVPYAIVVTFEIASAINANVYQEIASRIRLITSARVRT